jgi:hypothetical protein
MNNLKGTPMKKTVYVFVVFILTNMLTGCIDIFQHITRTDSGIDQETIKITVSKVVLAMGNENIDYDEWLGENSDTLKMEDYNAFSATIEQVNDMLDIGYLINMNIDYRDKNVIDTINNSDMSFIPVYTENSMVITISALSEPDDDSLNEMVAAFLSTGKYRLSISKKCIGTIVRAVIETDDNEMDIVYLDMNDEFLIEVPLPLFFNNDVKLVVYSK